MLRIFLAFLFDFDSPRELQKPHEPALFKTLLALVCTYFSYLFWLGWSPIYGHHAD
jgi:hypothetical protein